MREGLCVTAGHCRISIVLQPLLLLFAFFRAILLIAIQATGWPSRILGATILKTVTIIVKRTKSMDNEMRPACDENNDD